MIKGDSRLAGAGFVVIGRNEGRRLIDCLVSLQPFSCPIVYVDSASSDGSPAAARRLGAIVINLDLSRPFTPGRARNEGYQALLEKCPGLRFVQFVDGDCKLAPGWLESALAFLENEQEVGAVCGRRREICPDASVYNRLCDTEWNTPVGNADACGGDALFRSAAFEAEGGFNPQLMAGEEPELCFRLRNRGWTIWRLDADMTLHDAAMTRFRQWWLRAVRSGFGYAQVWDATRHTRHPLYAGALRRSIFWGGLVPLTGLAAGVLFAPALLAPIIAYGLQVLRLAFRLGARDRHSWERAFFLTLAKLPELQGVLRFTWRKRLGLESGLIEYKAAGVGP